MNKYAKSDTELHIEGMHNLAVSSFTLIQALCKEPPDYRSQSTYPTSRLALHTIQQLRDFPHINPPLEWNEWLDELADAITRESRRGIFMAWERPKMEARTLRRAWNSWSVLVERIEQLKAEQAAHPTEA